MKIDLVVESPAGHCKAFVSNGCVRGVATLHLQHDTAVSRVTVSLYGISRLLLTPPVETVKTKLGVSNRLISS